MIFYINIDFFTSAISLHMALGRCINLHYLFNAICSFLRNLFYLQRLNIYKCFENLHYDRHSPAKCRNQDQVPKSSAMSLQMALRLTRHYCCHGDIQCLFYFKTIDRKFIVIQKTFSCIYRPQIKNIAIFSTYDTDGVCVLTYSKFCKTKRC